jgi:hypothetical protein
MIQEWLNRVKAAAVKVAAKGAVAKAAVVRAVAKAVVANRAAKVVVRENRTNLKMARSVSERAFLYLN